MVTVVAVDTERIITWILAIDKALEDKMMPVFDRVELRKTRSDMVSAVGYDPRVSVWN